MPRISAGLLMYRIRDGKLQMLLAHPGGPFFQNKDDGAWSIPKGLVEEGEDRLEAAKREFLEETSILPVEPFIFHDLRRTMRTKLSALPIPYEIRERMIAHKRGALDQVYDQHDFRAEKARGFKLWEQRLLEIVEPKPANVVALPVGR